MSTSSSELPDLWERKNEDSEGYIIRSEVSAIFQGIYTDDNENEGLYGYCVYYVTDKDCFYVQYDPVHSSTMTYYGPFDGHPRDVLDIKFKKVEETSPREK